MAPPLGALCMAIIHNMAGFVPDFKALSSSVILPGWSDYTAYLRPLVIVVGRLQKPLRGQICSSQMLFVTVY